MYFGVQFWGECWSGPAAHVTYDNFGQASNCYKNMVGLHFSNYVYRLTGEGASWGDGEGGVKSVTTV